MTMTTSRLDVALASFGVLSRRFGHALQGRTTLDDTTTTAVCHYATGQTRFFLNPWEDADPLVVDNNHLCVGSDWILLLILLVLTHAISWWGRWLVWEPLADRIMSHNNSTNNSTANNTPKPAERTRILRLISMNMTAATFFTVSAWFSWKVIASQQAWIWTPSVWHSMVYQLPIDSAFKFYYLVYAARFLSDSVSLLYEERRWDTLLVSCIHHVITLALVLGSAHWGLTCLGGPIMCFFDYADPPLLVAKTCKYLSEGRRQNQPKQQQPTVDYFQMVANRLFELFAVLFFLTRNVLYNYVVYVISRDLGYLPFFTPFLVLLAMLQTYWLYLLIQAVIRQIQNGGVVEDVREDAGKKQN